MRTAVAVVVLVFVSILAPFTPSQAAPSVNTTTPCPVAFSDVHHADFFYEPVRYLVCNGAVSGYADGTFRPYNNTTRAQLAKIVVIAEQFAINTTGGPHFGDVPSSNPFYSYIETAFNQGIIAGYGDGSFKPFNNVTRAQLSKIIVGAEGWPLVKPGYANFTDVPNGSPFYSFIETAFNRGIINGYADYSFRPGAYATRGQIAKIVYLAVAGPEITVTPRATATGTSSPTATETFTPEPTVTETPTAVDSASPTPAETATPTATPGLCANTGAGYRAVASVSNGAPSQNEIVTVYGRICHDNQPVAGATMNAKWNYRTTTSTCDALNDDQGGAACSRDIARATIGYSVRIDVRFYNGAGGYLAGAFTSFTPR